MPGILIGYARCSTDEQDLTAERDRPSPRGRCSSTSPLPALRGTLRREGSVPLDAAIRSMTLGGAEAVGRGDRQDSTEVGRSTDPIVLDRDLYGIPADQVGGARVLRTVFKDFG